ncbi:MAG: SRPBCC family protein [Caldilineaceae bacterium]|nr:SRPBCC family protein [Caldilineaceae bacterium]
MDTVRTESSAVIDAPPAEVYAIFADYRNAHPQILPKPYFGDLKVEQGGVGAGTVYRTSVTVMGMSTNYHMAVTEPEPGRLLVEKDLDLDVTTSFRVEPVEDGRKSRVTIATDWRPKPGIRGWIEKLSTPGVMRKLYDAELKLVQEYVKNKQRSGGGGGGGFE